MCSKSQTVCHYIPELRELSFALAWSCLLWIRWILEVQKTDQHADGQNHTAHSFKGLSRFYSPHPAFPVFQQTSFVHDVLQMNINVGFNIELCRTPPVAMKTMWFFIWKGIPPLPTSALTVTALFRVKLSTQVPLLSSLHIWKPFRFD